MSHASLGSSVSGLYSVKNVGLYTVLAESQHCHSFGTWSTVSLPVQWDSAEFFNLDTIGSVGWVILCCEDYPEV